MVLSEKESVMEFRHEWKNTISRTDVLTLEHRLAAVAKPDSRSRAGQSCIHTLYFDDTRDFPSVGRYGSLSAREIYRIRYYNDNTDQIRLEKVSSGNGVCGMESCEVTGEFVMNIIKKNFSAIIKDPMGRTGDDLDPLIQEFYWKVIGNGLKPKIVTDFMRKSFIYARANVRIHIDYDLRAGYDVDGFLDPGSLQGAMKDTRVSLKVTWDKYLPEVIRSAITLTGHIVNYYSQGELRRAFV